jgi:hypothetical protein
MCGYLVSPIVDTQVLGLCVVVPVHALAYAGQARKCYVIYHASGIFGST